jgi:NAD(P)-dependent dehydrogenase (short-subunit alcohol dehydrogenase family)
MSSRLSGKVAVVTGGSMGIGEATCLLFGKEGAKVAVTDINDALGQEVIKKIKAAGGEAQFWHLNTAKEQEAKDVMADINKTFGKIDILVNNAGIAGADKPTHEITEAEWDALTAVNVKGVFFCTKHALPYMLKNKSGSIVNISSIYGLVGAPDLPPYHASKGAVRLMSKTDAMIYAKDNIRVNSVHPGYIWTPLVETFAKAHGDTEQFRKEVGNLHPLGHMGESIDIAYGILYLASDESKFVTGSELVIDGGYTAR